MQDSILDVIIKSAAALIIIIPIVFFRYRYLSKNRDKYVVNKFYPTLDIPLFILFVVLMFLIKPIFAMHF